jgi:hypothetical protein
MALEIVEKTVVDAGSGTPKDHAEAVGTTGDGASGWETESHSTPTGETPDDTTLASRQAAATDDDDTPDKTATPPVKETDDAIATPPAKQTAAPDKKAKGGKRGESLQQRIDRSVAAQRKAERAAEAAEAKAAELAASYEQQIRDLQAKRGAIPETGAPAKPATPPADDGPGDMPDVPQFADFDTDEEYRAAVATYKGALATWMTKHGEALERKITSGLDARLTAEQQQSQVQAHQTQVLGHLSAVRQKYPDFADKVAANAEVLQTIGPPQSHADMAKMGTFVHDLVTTTGENGAEFYHDLISDPEYLHAVLELEGPTRVIADFVRESPASRALMRYFASSEGQSTYMKLRALPPLTVGREIGRLEGVLESADRGSDPRPTVSITRAHPPVKPPVGSPNARVVQERPEPGEGGLDIEARAEADHRATVEHRRKLAAGEASP